MIDFTSMLTGAEAERCLREGAVSFGTLLYLLAEKGIITNEEFESAKVIVRAEMDQLEAARRDE